MGMLGILCCAHPTQSKRRRCVLLFCGTLGSFSLKWAELESWDLGRCFPSSQTFQREKGNVFQGQNLGDKPKGCAMLRPRCTEQHQ